MKTDLKKPCSDCPFRKKHMSGWLGPYEDPRELIVLVEFDQFPCHKTMGGSGCEQACAGAAHFEANKLHMPRDADLSELRKKLGRSDDVFASNQEFIAHHEALPA